MIGIIILNYNTWDESIACIKSIHKHISCNDYIIYLVDNNSPNQINKKQLLFIKNDKKTKLIMSQENKGYSAGNNIGLKAALKDKCQYFLISNSDIIFTDDSINKMRDFLKSNNRYGMVGPQIYNSKNKFVPFLMCCKLTTSGKIKNILSHTPFRFLSKKFMSKFAYTSELSNPLQVWSCHGSCFMLNKSCLEFLFPLDEHTFLYEEEYIIGSRLEKSKFKVAVIPNTHVIHAEGKSTGGISKFSYDCLVNSEQYYLKYYTDDNIFQICLMKIIRKLAWIFIYKK